MVIINGVKKSDILNGSVDKLIICRLSLVERMVELDGILEDAKKRLKETKEYMDSADYNAIVSEKRICEVWITTIVDRLELEKRKQEKNFMYAFYSEASRILDKSVMEELTVGAKTINAQVG
jgi:hypothetical protein